MTDSFLFIDTSQTLSTFPTAPQPYTAYPMVVQPNPMGAPPYPTYPMGAQSFQPPENKMPDQQFASNGYTNVAFQPPPYTQN